MKAPETSLKTPPIPALNFQRDGSASNAHVGREFEAIAMRLFEAKGIKLQHNYKIPVGIGSEKKIHAFDLGSDLSNIIVECKSHKWTKGNNVPSAKMTVWNEAMYYFIAAPTSYRKILFVLRDRRESNQETLMEYYIRTYRHLVPENVEFWEYDSDLRDVRILIPNEN
jgi:hypothetical protein